MRHGDWGQLWGVVIVPVVVMIALLIVGVMVVAFLVLWAYRHPMFQMVQGPQLHASSMLRIELTQRLQDEYSLRIKDGADTKVGSDFEKEVRADFEDGWPEVWELRPTAGPTGALLFLQATADSSCACAFAFGWPCSCRAHSSCGKFGASSLRACTATKSAWPTRTSQSA